MKLYDVELETDEVVGCTYGKATPQKSEAILTQPRVGLFDFLKIGDILTQINGIIIKSDVSVEDARAIAEGKTLDNRHDVIATLDIIGEINAVMTERLHPIMPGSVLTLATSEQIGTYLGFVLSEGKIKIGHLKRRHDVPIVMDNSWFDKHISVMGMTGAGKSNLTKIILKSMQETITTPILIIDPHGEYQGDIIEVDKMVIDTKEVALSDVVEAMNNILSQSEQNAFDEIVRASAISSTIKKKGLTGLDALIECCQEFYVRGAMKYRKRLIETATNLGVTMHIKKRMEAHWGSIPLVISLKGVDYIQAEGIVKGISDTVLQMGKAGKPIITFIDECHNYCPQKRNAICKGSIITLISEGRKFGCGVVLASQRPAKVDKDIISQCNTKFCLKLTNENDIKQVRASTEYANKQMFDEVQKLGVGEALLTSPWIKRPVFIMVDKYIEEVKPRVTYMKKTEYNTPYASIVVSQ